MATKEEKEEAALAAAEALKNPTPLSDEESIELEQEAERIKADQEAKEAAKKAAKKETQGEQMYSKAQVEEMMREMLKEMRAENKSDEDEDEEDKFAVKKIRLPRLKNKFIVGFKNMNTDEYFPELVTHAYDIWNDQQKRNVAHVTVVFEDGEEFPIALYTVLTKSTKVDCDLIETDSQDKSLSNGKVEVVDVDGYTQKGTGTFIKLKVKQAEYKFKLRLPDGKEVIVGPEVINW